MTVYFHCTQPQYIDSILRYGLIPSNMWEDRFPVTPEQFGTPLDIRGRNVHLTDSEGGGGAEAFVEDIMWWGKTPLKITLPRNWPLHNLGYETGILVSRKHIPPKYIKRISIRDLARYFPEFGEEIEANPNRKFSQYLGI